MDIRKKPYNLLQQTKPQRVHEYVLIPPVVVLETRFPDIYKCAYLRL